MSEKQTFEVLLEKHEKTDATGITIPFDVEQVFGAKRVPVKIKINDAQYRTTIFHMKGKYMLVVPKAFREAAGVKGGEMISVEIERDTEKRTVEVPEDFAEALRKSNLTDAFAKMSYTHQKEYVNAINEAKKQQTRARRIEKSLEEISKKKK